MSKPTYKTILAAKHGFPEAMNAIINHYSDYMTCFAASTIHDSQGMPHSVVDTEMLNQLKSELAVKIVFSFDATRLPDGEILEG